MTSIPTPKNSAFSAFCLPSFYACYWTLVLVPVSSYPLTHSEPVSHALRLCTQQLTCRAFLNCQLKEEKIQKQKKKIKRRPGGTCVFWWPRGVLQQAVHVWASGLSCPWLASPWPPHNLPLKAQAPGASLLRCLVSSQRTEKPWHNCCSPWLWPFVPSRCYNRNLSEACSMLLSWLILVSPHCLQDETQTSPVSVKGHLPSAASPALLPPGYNKPSSFFYFSFF